MSVVKKTTLFHGIYIKVVGALNKKLKGLQGLRPHLLFFKQINKPVDRITWERGLISFRIKMVNQPLIFMKSANHPAGTQILVSRLWQWSGTRHWSANLGRWQSTSDFHNNGRRNYSINQRKVRQWRGERPRLIWSLVIRGGRRRDLNLRMDCHGDGFQNMRNDGSLTAICSSYS